jgi:DNA-binding beta-propeller fold protein YncE
MIWAVASLVFDEDARGDAALTSPVYAASSLRPFLNPAADQFAISVQQLSMVAFYRREAAGLEAPLRIIEGPDTGLADPHGIHWDVKNHELIVANHGNSSVIASYSAYDAGVSTKALSAGGHFLPPSLTIFDDSAKAMRSRAHYSRPAHALELAYGVDLDAQHDEIAVADNGDNSVVIFRRPIPATLYRCGSFVAPHRHLSPMGVAVDAKNDEIWVANYGDHTAAVYAHR